MMIIGNKVTTTPTYPRAEDFLATDRIIAKYFSKILNSRNFLLKVVQRSIVKQIKVKISTHWYRKYIRCPKERVLLIGKHCKIFPKTIRCILLSRKS